MIVITGGAGFIGSNLVAALEERGEPDLVVCDRLGHGDKWRNLGKRELAALLPPEALFAFLDHHAREIETVFHLGAISSTTETDADLVIAANFTLSQRLWDWCTASETRLIYASSAATYGDGSAGFDDDGAPAALAKLRPLNAYGWSKHLFDRHVARVLERARQAAAAMGGPQILQRLRAERVSQGRRCAASWRRSSRAPPRASRRGFSARIATASPMAGRSATSSMSATAST